MKRKIFAPALLVVLAAIAVLTCSEPKSLVVGTGAELTGLSIGSTLIQEIPDAIISRDWDNDTFSLNGAKSGYVNFKLEADTKVQRIKPVVSKGAISQWGLGTRSTRPNEFYDTRVPISFESDEYIYIRVTAQDGKTTNYYRFFTKLLSFVTHLNTIEIAGRSKAAKTPARDYADAEPVDIDIAISESHNPTIETFVFDPNSTVRIASAKPDAVPDFVSPDTPLNFDDGDILYVEVTAENTVDKDYYKFVVRVGHLADIKTLKMIDEANAARSITVYNKGLFDKTWSKVGPGGFATADLPAAGYKVGLEFEDDQATAKYLLTETYVSGTQPNFVTDNVAPNKVKFSFDAPKLFVLAIEVTAPRGDKLYYAIKADILAAIITEQPRSEWYYAEYLDFNDPSKDPNYSKYYPQTYPAKFFDPDHPDQEITDPAKIAAERTKLIAAKKAKQTIKPLTFKLDRTGNFTYQWYSADSWYGFYGRHGTALDEKGNISCVNGGPNQYFYLVDPDKPQHPFSKSDPNAWLLTGETNDTFTPPNNWKNVPQVGGTIAKPPTPPTPPNVNFVTGSTGECRYYWCVITDEDTGLKVVSERALIITEAHPAMEHYIFELTDLARKKNEAPFKVLRELYKIPLVYGAGPNKGKSIFPEGFDPTKYVSMTAIAQFFLPDGRAWTQNWTHGDIHFGYTPGSPSYIANESQELVWWQNNLGANSGAIPLHSPHSLKGGLNYPPDWIGFAPSGDPTKRVPAANWNPAWPEVPPGTPPPIMVTDITLGTTADNTYVNKAGELPKGIHASAGNWPSEIAQGWFAGFIELLEVRFTTDLPKD